MGVYILGLNIRVLVFSDNGERELECVLLSEYEGRRDGFGLFQTVLGRGEIRNRTIA